MWKVTFILILITSIVLVMQPEMIFGRQVSSGQDPQDHTDYYKGALASTCVSVFGAALCVILSGPLKDVNSSNLMFQGGLASFLVAIGMMLFGVKQRIFSSAISTIAGEEWVQLILNGSLGIIGFLLNFKSLQLIDAVSVNALMALQIVFAFIFQIYPMGQIPNALGFLGAVMTFLCVIALVMEDKAAARFGNSRQLASWYKICW